MILSLPSPNQMWVVVRAPMYSFQICAHCWGIFTLRADFQACWKRVECSESPMWLIWVLFILVIWFMISIGSLWESSQPIQGSCPILTVEPDWIFHVMPALVMSKDLRTTFHIIDIPEEYLCGCLNQSITLRGAMYLETATLVHKLLDGIRCHLSFAARAEEKSSNFLMPHTPHFFGSLSASHLTQA